MSRSYISSYHNPEPYIPGSLSEIYDLLGSMILSAPTFIDKLGDFPEQNIDSEFQILVASFAKVRRKLGEERYTTLVDLAARAKALFAADPDENNGKANEGWTLLQEIEAIIQSARKRRVAAELKDDEGEVSGD